jgi:hypothetical protein
MDEYGKIPFLRRHFPLFGEMARVTRLELATSGVTGRRSNQLSYTRLCASIGGEAAQV